MFFLASGLGKELCINGLATLVIIMRPSAGKHIYGITLDNWPIVKRYG